MCDAARHFSPTLELLEPTFEAFKSQQGHITIGTMVVSSTVKHALVQLLLSLVAVAEPVHAQRLSGSFFGVPGTSATYDYVVVGGGTAGLALATRLAEGNASVAVIEAGGFYETDNGNLSVVPGYVSRLQGSVPWLDSCSSLASSTLLLPLPTYQHLPSSSILTHIFPE